MNASNLFDLLKAEHLRSDALAQEVSELHREIDMLVETLENIADGVDEAFVKQIETGCGEPGDYQAIDAYMALKKHRGKK